MVREWEELKKAGGITINVSDMERLFEESDGIMISREELVCRVTNYFRGCMQEVIDGDTGEMITTWKRNPTKTGLALAVGVDTQTLVDYCKGTNSHGKPYTTKNAPNKVVSSDDFDIIRKAYALIENFYEEKLAENRNNAGAIYWLNNRENTKWSNQQEFVFGANLLQNEYEYMKGEKVPELMEKYNKYKEDDADELF